MARKKILLVDDSSTILMMEKFILRNHPYVIITATSGEEAVQRATAEHPDLILLDVVMPGMSGFDTCRALRERERTKHIPIVMVATRGEAASFEPGEAGCTDRVTKPINAIELLEKVRRLLAEPAPPRR